MTTSLLIWILAISLPLAHSFNFGVAWQLRGCMPLSSALPVRSTVHHSLKSFVRKEHETHKSAKKVQLTATEMSGEGTVNDTEHCAGADELTLQDLMLASAVQVCSLPLFDESSRTDELSTSRSNSTVPPVAMTLEVARKHVAGACWRLGNEICPSRAATLLRAPCRTQDRVFSLHAT
jgi:hypothetical protein